MARWKRRTIVGTSVVLVIAIGLVGGVYFYSRWQFDRIHKVHIKHGLLASPIGNAPFDILVVGSDSRSFVDSTQLSNEYGNQVNQAGQRSDVTMVVRVSPALHQIKILSIPRDTWVDIPGTSIFAGPNKINASYNEGPGLLIQTIKNNFDIPITYYVAINIPGLQNMVNAVGGVGLDFPMPVRDTSSHLGISLVGCHLVMGSQAVALVRSRHLQYFSKTANAWLNDGSSDLGRIQLQDAFFRALLPKISGVASNPIALNDLLNAAVHNIEIDDTLSYTKLVWLAKTFRHLGSSGFSTETLPTESSTSASGESILLPITNLADHMVSAFLNWGYAKAPHSSTTTSSSTPTTAVASTSSTESTTATTAPVTTTAAPTSVAVTTLPGNGPIGSSYVNLGPRPWEPVPCTP